MATVFSRNLQKSCFQTSIFTMKKLWIAVYTCKLIHVNILQTWKHLHVLHFWKNVKWVKLGGSFWKIKCFPITASVHVHKCTGYKKHASHKPVLSLLCEDRCSRLVLERPAIVWSNKHCSEIWCADGNFDVCVHVMCTRMSMKQLAKFTRLPECTFPKNLEVYQYLVVSSDGVG